MKGYTTTRPTKEAVRAYLATRLQRPSPLPTPNEIKNVLDWKLIKAS